MLMVFFSLQSQEVTLVWNTFMGGYSNDEGYDIVPDGNGNVYMTGFSDAAWGSPVNPYSGFGDGFVAKLDSVGNLVWNTFLGGTSIDESHGISLDDSGNIYVAGYSEATWGSPVNGFSGGWDAFVAKLDNNGILVWHTFLGGAFDDYAVKIALDDSGNIYVTGSSDSTWGSPVNGFSGGWDAFVAKLDNDGNLVLHTFLGSTLTDHGGGINLDGSGHIFVTGNSIATWGSPVRGFSGGLDAFVAELDNDGNLVWHTFLGGNTYDYGRGIATDDSGNIYVAGYSEISWGTPVNAHSGIFDAFVAKLDSDGNLVWNTFHGGNASDYGRGIAIDDSKNIYVTGDSGNTWGSPVNGFNGVYDVFVAKLDNDGNLVWNTFLGGTQNDYGIGCALDDSGYVYLIGFSNATWGSPVHSFYYVDVFVAKLAQHYRVNASSSGSHGSVSPATQWVIHGANAEINITPDSGYRIKCIVDNDRIVSTCNPYVCCSVCENHNVVVTFEPETFPPAIDLTAVRKTESAWIIRKDYGEINIEITEHATHPMEVAKFILYRIDSSNLVQLIEYTAPGSYVFIDKFLESGKSYGYQVTAVDGGGTVVAESDVVTL
jgi:hypothetical protein